MVLDVEKRQEVFYVLPQGLLRDSLHILFSYELSANGVLPHTVFMELKIFPGIFFKQYFYISL